MGAGLHPDDVCSRSFRRDPAFCHILDPVQSRDRERKMRRLRLVGQLPPLVRLRPKMFSMMLESAEPVAGPSVNIRPC